MYMPGESSDTRGLLNSPGDLQPQNNGNFLFTSFMNFQAKRSFPGNLISRIQEVRVGTSRKGWGEGVKRCPSLKVWLGSTMTVIQGCQAEGNTVGWEDWVWVLLSLRAILVFVSGQRAGLQRILRGCRSWHMQRPWLQGGIMWCNVCALYVQCKCLLCAMWCANVCHCNISAPLLVHMITLHFKKLKKI